MRPVSPVSPGGLAPAQVRVVLSGPDMAVRLSAEPTTGQPRTEYQELEHASPRRAMHHDQPTGLADPIAVRRGVSPLPHALARQQPGEE